MKAVGQGKWLSSAGAAGLVILVLGLALLSATAALPYYGFAATQDQFAERAAELRFLETRLRSAAKPRQNITEADDYGLMFLAGKTSGLALADLQRRMAELAAASGLRLERAQPLSTDYQDGAAVLRMEVAVNGSIESLRNYLVAIETGLPLIFVREATISAAKPAATEDAGAPTEFLSATFQIESFGWWEAALQ